jgi:hypothetical protein
VFLQDGSGDLNIYGGDWWMANQTMERALEFSGYEVNHVWGDGHHSGKQITANLPDALRWLWKDWPKPVGNGPTQNGALKALLISGEGWQRSDLATGAPGGHLGPDGRTYCATLKGIRVAGSDGYGASLAGDLSIRDLVVAHNGLIYATETGPGGNVSLVRPDGGKQVVDTGLKSATGVTLSPDQSLLYVADAASHWVYSYQVRPDGTLADKQRYYWLVTADDQDGSNAGGMCCDQAGWLYVATDLGVQICDQAGRVNAIVPSPGGAVTGVSFGGKDFDTLYAASAGGTFKRRLNAAGANPWAAPTVPPAPKL